MLARLDTLIFLWRLTEFRDTYAVILYWDSDVSNVEEFVMNPNQVAELRSAYRAVSI
jgi:hypothetical protein